MFGRQNAMAMPQHGNVPHHPPERKSSLRKIGKFFKNVEKFTGFALRIAVVVAALNSLSTYGFSLDAIGGFLNIFGSYVGSAGETLGVFGLEINSSLDSITQALGGIADSASSIDLGFK